MDIYWHTPEMARFQHGQKLQVVAWANMRAMAGYLNKPATDLLTVLKPGAIVTVGNGSVDADGLVWWFVKDDADRWGYVAESDQHGVALLSEMQQPLTQPDIATIAAEYKLDPALAKAVLKIESGGQAFAPDGRMIIRFENHIFAGYVDRSTFDAHFRYNHASYKQHTGHQWRKDGGWMDCHLSQEVEWNVFNYARGFSESAAIKSISMGAPQIMGFNYAQIGYEAPWAMFDAFSKSADAQVRGFFEFMSISGALARLQNEDLVGFAHIYNGEGQEQLYAQLIRQELQ